MIVMIWKNWSSDIWNNTTIDFHSSPASITDSPNSNYQDNEDNIILLDSIIDLSDVTIAVVQFLGKVGHREWLRLCAIYGKG